MKNWIIKILGGYPDIGSAIDALKKTDDSENKRLILSEAVRKLYNSISEEDILRKDKNGSWIFRGRPLTQAEVAQLKQEAVLLKGSKLWFAIKQDIRYQLGKKMFDEAKVMDDILWGQLATYLFDIIKNRIDKMPVE